ncbi:MAG TPA: GH1 family beta-glucosidase [Sphingobium sp.]|uniref:GH1 family beta-glucosidase n=1 Tax=Sphingobium sp. TaxID=1912891 RepID=UPI002ED4550D
MISRRDVGKLIGIATASSTLPVSGFAKIAPRPLTFPAGFRWGCATAAYQIEGAVREDGRGESIWDIFSHTPGKIRDNSTADVACDSYHHYVDDAQALKNVGANSYRLSFAWPRIFPNGRGQPNQMGIDHYHRVIDNLLENGVEPYVTLFHWDLPTALPGGWQNRDTAEAFADYAGFVAKHFSDKVRHFMTLNEVRSFIDNGYGAGLHAPGLRLPASELAQARHHAIVAHGLGVKAIRANSPRGTQVGFAENPSIPIPTIDTSAHVDAAKKALKALNEAIFVPLAEGRYRDAYLAAEGGRAPHITSADLTAMASPVDFFGINVYTGNYVDPADNERGFTLPSPGPTYPKMGLDWLRVAPEAAYWGPRLISDVWNPRAIYISENGAVTADQLSSGGVKDTARIMYLRNYISQMQRAVAEGLPVKGYFLWSLLDNFEWSDGTSARFGIHYTDYATQRRIPKLSAAWFREVIRTNAVA